jgi:hypothetical protein
MREVEDYFVILITHMGNDAELNKFTRIADFGDYMTNQWIDNKSMPYCISNINDRSEDDSTNNACENWHSKWNKSTNANHQHIYKYLNNLNYHHTTTIINLNKFKQ